MTAILTFDNGLVEALHAAVKLRAEAEAQHKGASELLVSRTREVGVLLIECRKSYPKVKAWEEFLKRENLFSLSWSYEAIALASGRKAIEDKRADDRQRQAASRDRKKLRDEAAKALPKPKPEPEPAPKPEQVSVTSQNGQPEVDMHARMAALDGADDPVEEAKPVEAVKVIDKAILKEIVARVAALGIPAGFRFSDDVKVSFDDDIDLEILDAVEAAAQMLETLHRALEGLLEEPLAKRNEAERAARQAKWEAEAQAKKRAHVERLAWEVDHAKEARQKWRETLGLEAAQKEAEQNDEPFDRAAYDASFKDVYDEELSYDHPERDFFENWYKEHNAIWPHHADKPWNGKERKLEVAAFDLPSGINLEAARKLVGEAVEVEDDKAIAASLKSRRRRVRSKQSAIPPSIPLTPPIRSVGPRTRNGATRTRNF